MFDNQKKQQILITGCQRSGTTLLNLILDSHNKIKSIDEADFDITEMEKYLAELNSESHICLKLPEESSNMDFIKNKLVRPKVLWLMRDPRDVVASMINLHLKVNRFVSVSWALNYSAVEISKILKNIPSQYLSQYEDEIEQFISGKSIPSLLKNDDQVIFEAALCWKLKQISLDMFKDTSVDFQIVKYEDLVKNPRKEITSILSYLNLEWDENVLQHHLIHSGYSIGNTQNDRPIDKNNIGKWVEVLGKEEHKIIEEVCSEVASNFGYDKGWQDDKTDITSESEMVYLAEELIEKDQIEDARKILLNVLEIQPNNLDALNNLGVISVLKDNIDEAKNYINRVLAIEPTNEVAFENLNYLNERTVDGIPNANFKEIKEINLRKLNYVKIYSLKEYAKYSERNIKILHERNKFEKSLILGDSKFYYKGICHTCNKQVNFVVDYDYSYKTEFGRMPNWRESIVCPNCKLNNRMRLSLHIMSDFKKTSNIYIAEQISPVYTHLVKKFHNIVGSEFLGTKVPLGKTNNNGIRNEDFTNLTFPNEVFDLVLSFDVFEHIPDYYSAFTEAYRVLKTNGRLIFSVPFEKNSYKNIVRARIQNGRTEHILPPEMHGDPLNLSEGTLCYYHFGWEILDILRKMGFKDVHAKLFYSKEFGYLGGEQILFFASK